jgi:glucosamine--fructose-6-phosphate aminotransferase (isomerizing)
VGGIIGIVGKTDVAPLMLEGLISTHEPRKIFCARQNSPLVLGIDSETKFVSSDNQRFLLYARQSIPLDDGEYAILSPEAYYLKDIATGDERNNYVTKF